MSGLRRRLGGCLMIAFAAMCAAPSTLVSASGPNQLSEATISPREGTERDLFRFSVRYHGKHPASSVTAVVAGGTIQLTMISGTAVDATFSGAATVGVGTWPVIFIADAARGNDPSLDGGTLTVTHAPHPASSSPSNAARPASDSSGTDPTPTSTARSVSNQESTAASGDRAPSPEARTALAAAAQQAESDPGATQSPERAAIGAPRPSSGTGAERGEAVADPRATMEAQQAVAFLPRGVDYTAVWAVMLGGLGLIGVVVIYGFVLAPRREPSASLTAEVVSEPFEPEARRTPADWEIRAMLEEAPIGTVTADGVAMPTEGIRPADRRPRTNPHLARIQAARASRD